MSYELNGTQHFLAQFASAVDVSSTGLTLAMWVKGASTTLNDGLLALGNSSSNLYDYCGLRTTANVDEYTARSRNSANTTNGSASATDSSTGWIPLIGVFSAEDARAVFVNNTTNTNSTSIDTSTLSYLRVGADIDGTARASGYVAEIAVWNTALSGTDIDAYEAGTPASSISAANLIGYWALNVDDTTPTNAGVGSMTSDLSVSLGTPTYSTDHPPISAGTTKYLKLLAHSSASSATSVEGWVVSADDATYYGHFTGGEFAAGTGDDDGYGVLKVAVSEFGGEALTTSDTPQVVVRNTTYGTSMCDATVIEE